SGHVAGTCPEIQVILMTGYPSGHQRARAAEAAGSVFSFLSKPFSLVDILETVGRALSEVPSPRAAVV
ncbi:MAG: hypothetical protein M3O22_03400, partial [Pseudomonadota bacterium]|nr:hypothetical protein [Pseudomonadota bacterium]